MNMTLKKNTGSKSYLALYLKVGSKILFVKVDNKTLPLLIKIDGQHDISNEVAVVKTYLTRTLRIETKDAKVFTALRELNLSPLEDMTVAPILVELDSDSPPDLKHLSEKPEWVLLSDIVVQSDSNVFFDLLYREFNELILF